MSAIILCKIRGLSHDILTSAAKIVEKKKKQQLKTQQKQFGVNKKGRKKKKQLRYCVIRVDTIINYIFNLICANVTNSFAGFFLFFPLAIMNKNIMLKQ